MSSSKKEWLSKLLMLTCALLAGYVNVVEGQLAKTKLPMISAHRGASLIAPENTIAAFAKAIELGANFIELDVRTTADGVQVVVHDGSLKRTTGMDEKVDRINLVELKKLSAGNWFGKQFEGEKVPTLEEVCEFVAKENRSRVNHVKLYVDSKAIEVGDVIQILNQHGLLDSAVFFGDMYTLTEIKKVYEKARVMPSYPGGDKLKNVIRKLNPYAVDIPYEKLDAAAISLCHAQGIKVFSDLLGEYDTTEEYKKAIQLQVDLIQTDDVSGVLRVFDEY